MKELTTLVELFKQACLGNSNCWTATPYRRPHTCALFLLCACVFACVLMLVPVCVCLFRFAAEFVSKASLRFCIVECPLSVLRT
jgi:hypothetical protein